MTIFHLCIKGNILNIPYVLSAYDFSGFDKVTLDFSKLAPDLITFSPGCVNETHNNKYKIHLECECTLKR